MQNMSIRRIGMMSRGMQGMTIREASTMIMRMKPTKSSRTKGISTGIDARDES